jgi:hypothetical protein
LIAGLSKEFCQYYFETVNNVAAPAPAPDMIRGSPG